MQHIQDQTVKEGNTARFEVEMSHENVPVVWYRNEVKLHVGRNVVTHVEGKKHSLEMRMLTVDDTCQIKAEAKGIYSIAKLTIIGNNTLSVLFSAFCTHSIFMLGSNCLEMSLSFKYNCFLFYLCRYKPLQPP